MKLLTNEMSSCSLRISPDRWFGLGLRAVLPVLLPCLLVLPSACRAQDQRPDQNDQPTQRKTLAEQINGFSRELYRTAADREDPGKNLFLSPLSIHTAMTMTYAASDGTDRKTMGTALHLDAPGGDLLATYQKLLGDLQTEGSGIQMNVGNAIRTAPKSNLSSSYAQEMANHFSASVASLSGSPSDDADQLNQWVSDQTAGVIDQLVTPADLRNVLFVLLNAVYFKGTWTDKFKKKNTRDAPFHLLDGSTTTVPMMQRTGHYPVASVDENGTLVRLPYGPEERFGMMIFLPDQKQNPTDFFSTVYEASKQQWHTWMNKLNSGKTKIRLRLPRFDMTYGTTSMGPSLKQLGVPLRQVNLSRMGIGSIERLQPLHKATITVNEEGTEAAGATGVIGTTSLPPSVTVNRPFFFLIRDRKTGTILFMGTVYNPAE